MKTKKKSPAFKLSPHISSLVSDHDGALELFEKLFGMSVEERGKTESAVKCGDMTFHVEESSAGQAFFEFTTDDLEAARAELERRGCKMKESQTPEGDRSWLVATPFGFRFHLYQPR